VNGHQTVSPRRQDSGDRTSVHPIDLPDDEVAKSLGLGPVSTDAVGESLDAVNGVEASCGN